MGAGGVLAGRDPQAEVLHENERTRVSRLFLTGRTVVRKEPLGPDAERRLRRERAMLERLRGVAGVAQLEAPRYPGSIVLKDVGGTSLAELAKPLPIDVLIGLAVELAQAVVGMHRRGVMHRDITPANIVISGDGVPCLVDFSLATSFAEIRPEFIHHTQIVGTLAYLAPEQTGRTGRSVDQRADLYALGATLYELATGEPPFGSGDPLRLVHDHLARVPAPPAKVNPSVPGPLSEIILHLLEKEPDHRYQTADGVVHDLERVRAIQMRPAAASVRVGEHDVPLRLLPPRLVSRDDEVETLHAVFEDAQEGRRGAVLVGGRSGVGKTALVDELRPLVAGRGGWFVAGKFDQYRRDLEFNGVHQAFRALGRLLLAEPEAELTEVRTRILAALGPNAGLLTAVVPEFAALLAVPPDPGDPLTAQNRAQRMGVQALRAVASRKRPVVVFLDDLQWAGRAALGLVDVMLDEEPVEGLMLVGAYRDGDVDAAHPLTAPPSRWRDHTGARYLRLDNLRVSSLVTMVAEMLHADPATAAGLTEVIGPHTSGNPYETVELLNALRRDGMLTPTTAGWQWDTATVRAHLGGSEVGELLEGRVEAIPSPSRHLVEAMACLGRRVSVRVLQAATGEPAGVVEQLLAPALDEGVLVGEPGADESVLFRHDRIREAIMRGLSAHRRGNLQLEMARRLAEKPDLFVVAAEQYLPVVDAVDGPTERRRVVELLRRAAANARSVGDHARVSRLLNAALTLIDSRETATLVEIHTARQTALYSLGRLEEADEEYRTIALLCTGAVQRVDATCVQLRSLTYRKRFGEAIALGLESLRECGITVPAADRLPAELDHQFEYLYRWLDDSAADESARQEITDPTLLAATRLINTVLTPAYLVADHTTLTWLSLEALRFWVEHGTGRTLLFPVGHIGLIAVALRDDYAAGHRAMRRVLPLGEARGYEPETSHARFLFGLLVWSFKPIESGVQELRQARAGMIAGGDLTNVGYTYHTAQYLFCCAPTLDSFVSEVEAGLTVARRTGNEQVGQLLDGHRWLAGVLRGENLSAQATAFDRYADNSLALVFAHVHHAIAAAVLGDLTGLAQHTAAAVPLLPTAPGMYLLAVARFLHGLALADQVRARHGDEPGGLLSELDEVTNWLAERTGDAPDNFLHLLRLLEAERAWAVGDFHAAALGYDIALREAAGRQRPWHRALITERAARFHLAHGLEHTGHQLLAQARLAYAAWGATAKVTQLNWAYPTSRLGALTTSEPGGDRHADDLRLSSTVTTGTLDLLAILAASQALSSETDIERLHTRVAEVLSAMTGATRVHLLLWDADRRDWLLPAPDHTIDTATADGPHERDLPMSAVRYVRRTAETLIVDDATRDARFARDPYIVGLSACSLLAMPILGRGALRAVLLLENRLMRAAFTTERLDAVRLLAAQLAVSLDNAQLYADLTASRARIVAAADQARRRIERDLHDGAQQRLVTLAMRARIARRAVPPESGALREQLEALAAEATTAMAELRELARGIHPPTLAQGGLLPALNALARRSRVPVQINAPAGRRLPEPVEVAAYYVVAEALTNATKHAEPSIVTVEVEIDTTPAGSVLRVQVRDDGRGGAHFTGGSGLLGLRDRVETLGGRLALDSSPGTGTAVLAEFPLQRTGVGQ